MFAPNSASRWSENLPPQWKRADPELAGKAVGATGPHAGPDRREDRKARRQAKGLRVLVRGETCAGVNVGARAGRPAGRRPGRKVPGQQRGLTAGRQSFEWSRARAMQPRATECGRLQELKRPETDPPPPPPEPPEQAALPRPHAAQPATPTHLCSPESPSPEDGGGQVAGPGAPFQG